MTLSASNNDFFSKIAYYIRRISAWFARAGFGFFVVFAAGAALLATTVIGVLIAVAALFLNFGVRIMRGSKYQHQNTGPKTGGTERIFTGATRTKNSKAAGETLEAHKTANGWVIEPD
ncbi:hypothetical protein [Hirschia baltica]|uniref:DUF3742 family protein n=1 Tax=Hirschia baltica (strain ATCC 49814 / DSM 5838 / IFAM 1418) TaxID=582402 RepID=C6XME1_HIRBI|nr:hypothetical protein [Hirschia baltica]ACT58084.1 hypothetical protein Hbal_0382 [Hirschia baltica ATCC 49814]